jgi:hypothetical protein
MTQFKAQTTNTSNVWDLKKRYNVNSVVTKNGIEYQNITGKNSDPITLVDWIATRQPIGPVYTQSEVNALLLVKRNKTATGWESIDDTLHTVGVPQSIAEGVTANLTNNKGFIKNSNLPNGHTTFFDSATSKVLPVSENDFMSSSFMFKAKNNNVDGYFTIFIDIPSLGERFSSVHRFPKGANVEHPFNITINHYVSDQFKINGGVVKIVANSGNLSIYEKQFRFCLMHPAN